MRRDWKVIRRFRRLTQIIKLAADARRRRRLFTHFRSRHFWVKNVFSRKFTQTSRRLKQKVKKPLFLNKGRK